MIALKATLVTASVELRADLEPLTDHKLIEACAALPSADWLAGPDAAMSHVLGSLARRWLQLHEEVNGLWQASTLVAAADGTRKRHYVYGAGRAEVQGKLDDIRQRVRGGQPAVDSGVTLGAYLDRWLVDGLAEHKATTSENYATMVRKHITPAIGSVRLDRLSPLDVQSVVNAKRATHSASTVRLIFSVLHRALEQAVEWELMAHNPAAKVKRPRAGEPHDRFLLPTEAAQLLAAARGTRLYALVAVASHRPAAW